MAEESGERISNRATILALAAALLGFALHITDGLYSPSAIGLLTAAFVLCLMGAFIRGDILATIGESHLRIILVALACLQLLAMPFKPAGASAYTVPITDQRPFEAMLGIACVAIVLIGFGGRRVALCGLVLLLLTHASIGIWKIRTAPSPRMDVCVFHVDSARALAHGENPYAITFPDVYGQTTIPVYAPEAVRDGRCLFGYPYTPLPLLFTAPAQLLLGDFRYAQLAAMLACGALLAAIAGGRLGMLVAAMFLFTPRSFYILEMGWTEPLSVMLLTATVLCTIRWPRAMPVMFGLLIASKQYLPVTFLLLPMLSTRKTIIKDTAIALATAAIISLPLVLWDVRAFLHSAVTLQLHQPYRPDSLSFLAWWGHDRAGWIGPFWLAFVALFVSLAACLSRLSRDRGGFTIAVSVIYFAFFIFNKQAFANYYYFVLGGICCAVVTTIASQKLHSPGPSDR